MRTIPIARIGAFLVCSSAGLGIACSKDSTGPDDASVESVVVTPPSGTVLVGSTMALSAEVLDGSGDALPELHVSWASEDPTIAEVSQGGIVTGRKVGTVLIAASSRGKDAFSTITVSTPAVRRVVLAPSNPRIDEGESIQLTATVYDIHDHVMPGLTVTWASSNTGRATVTSTGLVQGVRDGMVTITAKVAGKSGSTSVRIDD